MSSAWDGLENSPTRTQLPHYAVNAAAPADAFYTDRKVAEKCVNDFLRVCQKYKISLSDCTFIEPSAGGGRFYDFLPDNKIGLDIAPRDQRIKKADFLTWKPSKEGKYIVIGNPLLVIEGRLP